MFQVWAFVWTSVICAWDQSKAHLIQFFSVVQQLKEYRSHLILTNKILCSVNLNPNLSNIFQNTRTDPLSYGFQLWAFNIYFEVSYCFTKISIWIYCILEFVLNFRLQVA